MNSAIFRSILLGTALALASSPAGAAALSKKTVRKIANQEITKRAPSLRGAAGPVGATGPVGDTGPAGPAAVQLYARILADGFVVPSRSFGITQDNVFLDGTTYCFTGLPPINGAQVTVDYFQTSSNETAKFGLSDPADPADPGCEGEGFVKVFDGPGNETPGGFFIILY